MQARRVPPSKLLSCCTCSRAEHSCAKLVDIRPGLSNERHTDTKVMGRGADLEIERDEKVESSEGKALITLPPPEDLRYSLPISADFS